MDVWQETKKQATLLEGLGKHLIWGYQGAKGPGAKGDGGEEIEVQMVCGGSLERTVIELNVYKIDGKRTSPVLTKPDRYSGVPSLTPSRFDTLGWGGVF